MGTKTRRGRRIAVHYGSTTAVSTMARSIGNQPWTRDQPEGYALPDTLLSDTSSPLGWLWLGLAAASRPWLGDRRLRRLLLVPGCGKPEGPAA
jgi:hypothetical protein